MALRSLKWLGTHRGDTKKAWDVDATGASMESGSEGSAMLQNLLALDAQSTRRPQCMASNHCPLTSQMEHEAIYSIYQLQ